MSGLKARIIKLERSIPTGLEAELASMSDEEIEQEIAELFDVSVEEVRAWTPEELRRRADESRAALSEAEATEYDNR
jgi:ribosomal protein L29